jgi:hypothetical protein
MYPVETVLYKIHFSQDKRAGHRPHGFIGFAGRSFAACRPAMRRLPAFPDTYRRLPLRLCRQPCCKNMFRNSPP